MSESPSTEPRTGLIVKCRDCGHNKPKIKDKRRCLDCIRGRAKEYAARPDIKERTKQRRSTEAGRAVLKAWRMSEKGRATRANYKKTGKMIAYMAEYAKMKEQRIRRAEYAKTEKARQQRAAYAATPHGKAVDRHKAARRRAREKSGTATARDVRIFLESAIHCQYCQKPISGEDRTLDHIQPLSRGGLHSVENFAAACRSCNSRKNSMPPEEWLARLLKIGSIPS